MILHLVDEEGVEYTDPKDIQHQVKRYFQTLYTSKGCNATIDLLQRIPNIITPDMNACLTRGVTE